MSLKKKKSMLVFKPKHLELKHSTNIKDERKNRKNVTYDKHVENILLFKKEFERSFVEFEHI